MRIFVQIPDLKNFEELFGLHWTTMTPEDQHTESAGAILPVSVLRVPTQLHPFCTFTFDFNVPMKL